MSRTPTLYVFGGLPGVGKTTLARRLARHCGALHLRIDTIEQALRTESGTAVDETGYVVAGAVAADNLRLDRDVIADAANVRDVARCVEVELVCSDGRDHRRRVESRPSDIAGLLLPDWPAVCRRAVDAWTGDHVVLDTANRSVEAAFSALIEALQPRFDRAPAPPVSA